MRIAEVESLLLRGAHFVRITTEQGQVGLGQSACWAYPEAVDAIIPSFRAYLVGKDPRQIERHWQHLYGMGPFRGSVLSGAVSATNSLVGTSNYDGVGYAVELCTSSWAVPHLKSCARMLAPPPTRALRQSSLTRFRIGLAI